MEPGYASALEPSEDVPGSHPVALTSTSFSSEEGDNCSGDTANTTLNNSSSVSVGEERVSNLQMFQHVRNSNTRY